MRVLAEPDDVAEAAAHEFMAIVSGAISQRDVAHVALTGGSTVPRLYWHLIGVADHEALDWAHVELWWGDERIVVAGDLAAHAHSARETLLGPASPARAARVHAFPLGVALRDGAARAAADYAAELEQRIPTDADGLPVFDLVLLGMGADGHILSVFPGSAALAPGAPLVSAVPAPTHVEPHLPRLTLNPRVIGAARHVVVMCTGAAKAARVAEVLAGPDDVERLPAQLARGDNAVWLLDAAAAAAWRPQTG